MKHPFDIPTLVPDHTSFGAKNQLGWSDYTIGLMPIAVGEVWYIKFPGAVAVSRVVITDVTGKTVEFEGQPIASYLFTGERRTRYLREDIKFIELVQPAKGVEQDVAVSDNSGSDTPAV